MTSEYHKLPGGCFVNQITPEQSQSGQNGILLEADLLREFGFSPDESFTMLFTQGRVIIVTDTVQQNLLSAIQELQIRQDEMKEDFAPAITQTLKLF